MPVSSASSTLADEIHEVLRRQIVSGELLPGERVNERTIARDRGASRTPVRESLRRLEQTGLVRRDGRAGYVVRRFDLSEIDQVYAVRIALETLAIESLGATAGARELADLREVWQAFPAHGDPSDALEMDEAFHEAIARLSGNAILSRYLEDVNERIHFIRRIDFTEPHRWGETKREHECVLEALESRDVSVATDLLRRHIERSKALVAELAQERLAQVYLRATERS